MKVKNKKQVEKALDDCLAFINKRIDNKPKDKKDKQKSKGKLDKTAA